MIRFFIRPNRRLVLGKPESQSISRPTRPGFSMGSRSTFVKSHSMATLLCPRLITRRARYRAASAAYHATCPEEYAELAMQSSGFSSRHLRNFSRTNSSFLRQNQDCSSRADRWSGSVLHAERCSEGLPQPQRLPALHPLSATPAWE